MTVSARPDRQGRDESVVVAKAGPGVEEVHHPGKALRIGTMAAELLAEVRNAPLDEAGRQRLRDLHDESIRELASTLSPDLVDELHLLTLTLDGAVPSEAELRVAQAQLVGWFEGLFHGIQAALLAQQVEAQLQVDRMREDVGNPGPSQPDPFGRTGNYL